MCFFLEFGRKVLCYLHSNQTSLLILTFITDTDLTFFSFFATLNTNLYVRLQFFGQKQSSTLKFYWNTKLFMRLLRMNFFVLTTEFWEELFIIVFFFEHWKWKEFCIRLCFFLRKVKYIPQLIMGKKFSDISIIILSVITLISLGKFTETSQCGEKMVSNFWVIMSE